MDCEVPIICYCDGRLVNNGGKPRYVGGHQEIIMIDKTTTYDELVNLIHELTSIDQSRYKLVMTCRYPTLANECMRVYNDTSVKVMLNLYPTHAAGVELYLEKEEVIQRGRSFTRVVDDDQEPVSLSPFNDGRTDMHTEWGTWPSHEFSPHLPSSSHMAFNVNLSPPPSPLNAAHPECPHDNDRDMRVEMDNEEVEVDTDSEHLESLAYVSNEYVSPETDVKQNADDEVPVEHFQPSQRFEERPPSIYTMAEMVNAAIQEGPETVYGHSSRSLPLDIEKDQIFVNKEALYTALREFSIRNSVQFKTKASTTKRLTVECKEQDCRWRMHAIKASGHEY
ncbi:hypothetical protein QJS10_CPA03g01002 [Acorus calamus]|uniref:Transposase MuDR plant domain-containing protein n=1 Tax=Acorus calamus TaxID=4465 RepID=A0AAV9F6Q9_ACOCL|nr:hypothetical protein QJS10_CPA03g01002 [Acorus calamus]